MSKREDYEKQTEEILMPMVESHGFELVDVEYVKEVGENLRDKGYDEYCKLRDGCGYYSNTDSVDIVTLASAYITDGSKDLVEAVEDAVLWVTTEDID